MRPDVLHNGRKGVSPLIAAVLLIAFTMAVAAILTAWVTTFTQEQTDALGNKSEEQIDCSFGQISIFSSDDNVNWVNASVENNGQKDFSNVSLTALSGGSVLGNAYLDGLNAGQVKSGNVKTDGTQADTLRVATEQCPAVTDTESLN